MKWLRESTISIRERYSKLRHIWCQAKSRSVSYQNLESLLSSRQTRQVFPLPVTWECHQLDRVSVDSPRWVLRTGHHSSMAQGVRNLKREARVREDLNNQGLIPRSFPGTKTMLWALWLGTQKDVNSYMTVQTGVKHQWKELRVNLKLLMMEQVMYPWSSISSTWIKVGTPELCLHYPSIFSTNHPQSQIDMVPSLLGPKPTNLDRQCKGLADLLLKLNLLQTSEKSWLHRRKACLPLHPDSCMLN